MQANPNKFQAIAVGKRSHEKSPTFNFGSINITCDEVVKLLGIDIDFRLSFDNHISNICKKSSTALEYTETNWEPPEQNQQIVNFHTFILSNFNVFSLAWLFCSEGKTKKMEKERDLRFVYDFNSSYEDLLPKKKKKKTVYQVYTLKK